VFSVRISVVYLTMLCQLHVFNLLHAEFNLVDKWFCLWTKDTDCVCHEM